MLERKKFFKPLFMRRFKLKDTLEKQGSFLGLKQEDGIKLCEDLGTEFYTYLVLGDGCDHEIVKVESEQGYLKVTRAQECTERREWPCSTCVEFHLTEQGLIDMNNQALPEQPPEEKIKCGWNGTLCIGRFNYTVENGNIAEESLAKDRYIPEGPVYNPELCFDKNGCITNVQEGKPRVAQFKCAQG